MAEKQGKGITEDAESGNKETNGNDLKEQTGKCVGKGSHCFSKTIQDASQGHGKIEKRTEKRKKADEFSGCRFMEKEHAEPFSAKQKKKGKQKSDNETVMDGIFALTADIKVTLLFSGI